MTTTIDGTTGVTAPSGAIFNGIASGTAVASTSGTSIDFTSIPSWVKRITVMFFGVSLSGTSGTQIQIGSGSVQNTGYLSGFSIIQAPSAVATGVSTTAFVLDDGGAAAYTRHGSVILTLITSNTWVSQGNLYGPVTQAKLWGSAGSVALSGALDRVRITTVNGTDTFDAGSVNIFYE